MIGKGGFIETPNQRLQVEHTLPVLTPEDLARVSVARRHGTTITLADIAVVKEGHLPLIGDAVINDGPGLMLVVEKFPWANTLELTRGVEDALDRAPARAPGPRRWTPRSSRRLTSSIWRSTTSPVR